MDIFPADIDLALFAVRLAVGIVFLAHGPVKFVQTKQVAAAFAVLLAGSGSYTLF